MCFRYFKRKKSERKVVKSINQMNKRLNTTFSFVYCLEEIDLLKLIPETDTQDKLRLEHLSCVLDLWLKGIKDEHAYKAKIRRDEDYIFDLFKVFRKKLFDLLIKNKCLPTGTLPESVVDKTYLVPIEKYEYINSQDRLDKISLAYETIDTINDKFNPRIFKKAEDPKVGYFVKLKYFGPMSIYVGYPKMIRRDEKFITKGELLPFEFKRRTSLRKSLKAEATRDIKVESDFITYYSKEYKLMEKRLTFEVNRIDEKHENYDFYFDAFLWRLLNDLEYLYSKKLGGIRKIIDLCKINQKHKSIKIGAKEKEAIVVDVDNMEATFDDLSTKKTKDKKSGGGKHISIHELDAQTKREIVRRDEIIRESQALSRRR